MDPFPSHASAHLVIINVWSRPSLFCNADLKVKLSPRRGFYGGERQSFWAEFNQDLVVKVKSMHPC